MLKVYNMKQYAQRTKGWYAARNTGITASAVSATMMQNENSCGAYLDYYNLRDNFKMDAKKTCSHRETQIDFILSKCDLGPKFQGNEFTRWGQKYENVVSNIYSQLNQVDVLEFGLIPHPTIDFLKASPDGITTEGVMLEIKCPPCRQVKNHPPIYYWQQMQLQLVCTNLRYCDYFDAHFVEYICSEDWEEEAREWKSANPDAKHHIYGMIVSHEKTEESDVEEDSSDEENDDRGLSDDQEGEEETPDVPETPEESNPEPKAERTATGTLPDKIMKHVYAPPNIVDVDDFMSWADQTAKELTSEGKDVVFTYYKLHEYYISRAEVNYDWFEKNLPHMEAVWKQVLHGRTKEGRETLLQILKDRETLKEDKKAKRKLKKEQLENQEQLSYFVDIDVSKALTEEPIQRRKKSDYIHDTCLL